MFENLTEEDLFNNIWHEGFLFSAENLGRIAITDNSELEKNWDQFVQSYREVLEKYIKWCQA